GLCGPGGCAVLARPLTRPYSPLRTRKPFCPLHPSRSARYRTPFFCFFSARPIPVPFVDSCRTVLAMASATPMHSKSDRIRPQIERGMLPPPYLSLYTQQQSRLNLFSP